MYEEGQMTEDFRAGLELAYERETSTTGVYHPVVDLLRIWDDVHGYEMTAALTVQALDSMVSDGEDAKAALLVGSFGHVFRGSSVGLMGACLMAKAMGCVSPIVRDGAYEALEQWIVDDDDLWMPYLEAAEERAVAEFEEEIEVSCPPPEDVGLCFTEETSTLMVGGGNGASEFVVGDGAPKFRGSGISLDVPVIPADYLNALQNCESSISLICAKRAMPGLLKQFGFSEKDTLALFEAVQIREMRETAGYRGEVVEDQYGPVLFAWNDQDDTLQLSEYSGGRWGAVLRR